LPEPAQRPAAGGAGHNLLILAYLQADVMLVAVNQTGFWLAIELPLPAHKFAVEKLKTKARLERSRSIV